MLPLFAVHISDHILTLPWIIGGFAAAILLAALGSWRLREEEIPRVAILSAAFFVATLIHVPLGPVRAHLLLNGLVGIVLGARAALAVPLALVLQALLLGHGGITTLGINTCIMLLPALAVWLVFAAVRTTPLLRKPRARWLIGFLLGFIGVGLTAVLNSLVLWLGGQEEWPELAVAVLLAHVPIAFIEGLVMAATVSFLARVKPEMLGLTPRIAAPSPTPQPQQQGRQAG